MDNLSYIGHCGNFQIEELKKKTATKRPLNLYDDMMFSYQGALSEFSDTKNIEQCFSGLLTGSQNIKILTFGLDSIFSASKAFPLSELESLSIFKYLDISSAMAGLKLPRLLGLMPSGGGGLRPTPPPQMPGGGGIGDR